MDLRLDLEEREQVVEVERLAGDGREARQQPFEKIAQPAERAGEERQVADGELAGQRAPHDVGIGEVVADGADRGEHAAPAGAPQRQPAIGRVDVRRQAAIAVDQEAVEAEDLHFLGRLDARRRLPHVVELAPLGRAQIVERIALRVEMRLAEERRHQGDEQQNDEPRRVDEQAGGEARHRHDVLRLPEQLAHQRHASAGLPARALELVLELGVLEILKVERRRMLHEADARGVGHALRQQAVDERDDAAENVGQHGKRKLDAEQQPEPVQQTALQPFL